MNGEDLKIQLLGVAAIVGAVFVGYVAARIVLLIIQ